MLHILLKVLLAAQAGLELITGQAVVAHTVSLSTGEAEASGSKFEASLVIE